MAAPTDYESLVLLAVIAVLLADLYFLFRAVPWTKPGAWRTVWLLAAIAGAMFILAEAAIVVDRGVSALAGSHQLPLFAALFAAAAAFFVAYVNGYRSAERARVLAMTDPVTELPNRRAFEERLRVAYERHERFSLLYVDLDGFKQVNDRLGHSAGDGALRQVAGVLGAAVRESDIAARVGGDEFCLLLIAATAQSTRVVAERVLRGVCALRLAPGISLGASFGVATERDGRSPQEVVAAADAAMYRAKREQGERIAFARPLGGAASS